MYVIYNYIGTPSSTINSLLSPITSTTASQMWTLRTTPLIGEITKPAYLNKRMIS